MLKLAAVVAAAAAIAAIVPLATIHNGRIATQSAEARGITPYDRCMINAEYGCYPRDRFSGQIRPPNLSDYDEAIAYETCLLAAIDACSGLPGDPG